MSKTGKLVGDLSADASGIGHVELFHPFRAEEHGGVVGVEVIDLGASTALRTVSPLPSAQLNNLYLVAARAQHPFRMSINAGTGLKCTGFFVAQCDSATLAFRNETSYAGGNKVQVLFVAQGTVL